MLASSMCFASQSFAQNAMMIARLDSWSGDYIELARLLKSADAICLECSSFIRLFVRGPAQKA